MALDVSPPIPPAEQQILSRALARLGLAPASAPASYASAWRLAGLEEATASEDEPGDYALSPRSTRGATRA